METHLVGVNPKKGILENSHFLLISKSFIRRAKTIRSDQLQMTVLTDTDLLHHQKDLFRCDELKAIASLDIQIDNFVKANSLPFPTHKGLYILPYLLFNIVENRLREFQVERIALVEKFINVYDQAVKDSKLRLNQLANENDYPSKEEARNAFKFSWRYKNFGVAENLEALNKEVAEREVELWKADIENGSKAIQQMLRAGLQSLVGHLVDRLSPKEDGGKKVFRASAIEGLNEFFATFPAKDLTNDTELKALVDQAKALTNGVTPEAIRTDEAFRENLQKQFSTIKSELDKLVINQPVRSISFED